MDKHYLYLIEKYRVSEPCGTGRQSSGRRKIQLFRTWNVVNRLQVQSLRLAGRQEFR